MRTFKDSRVTCPICSGDTFSLGTIREQGIIRFYVARAGIFAHKPEVQARVCHNCRHLDLFVPEFTPEDRSGL